MKKILKSIFGMGLFVALGFSAVQASSFEVLSQDKKDENKLIYQSNSLQQTIIDLANKTKENPLSRIDTRSSHKKLSADKTILQLAKAIAEKDQPSTEDYANLRAAIKDTFWRNGTTFYTEFKGKKYLIDTEKFLMQEVASQDLTEFQELSEERYDSEGNITDDHQLAQYLYQLLIIENLMDEVKDPNELIRTQQRGPGGLLVKLHDKAKNIDHTPRFFKKKNLVFVRQKDSLKDGVLIDLENKKIVPITNQDIIGFEVMDTGFMLYDLPSGNRSEAFFAKALALVNPETGALRDGLPQTEVFTHFSSKPSDFGLPQPSDSQATSGKGPSPKMLRNGAILLAALAVAGGLTYKYRNKIRTLLFGKPKPSEQDIQNALSSLKEAYYWSISDTEKGPARGKWRMEAVLAEFRENFGEQEEKKLIKSFDAWKQSLKKQRH